MRQIAISDEFSSVVLENARSCGLVPIAPGIAIGFVHVSVFSSKNEDEIIPSWTTNVCRIFSRSTVSEYASSEGGRPLNRFPVDTISACNAKFRTS